MLMTPLYLLKNDEGFVESFKMIENFGKATNSKLNIQKTKVYGFGLWRDRVNKEGWSVFPPYTGLH